MSIIESKKTINTLKRPPISKLVQNYIREYIMNENLQPGDALPVHGKIAQELGVSIASVREAVRVIEALGIIEVRHGDGLYVRHMNLDGVFDVLSFIVLFEPSALGELLQLRRWWEISLIPKVIRMIQREDIANCERIIDEWEKRMEADLDCHEQDRAFHQALYRPIANHLMLKLADVFFLVSGKIPQISKEVKLKTLNTHKKILSAVIEKDESKAKSLISAHFEVVQRSIDKNQIRSEDKS